jgi:hypothetical protein
MLPKTSRRPLTREEETAQAELEAELRQAERDFENGDFIELTDEQFDRIVETGESPWLVGCGARQLSDAAA